MKNLIFIIFILYTILLSGCVATVKNETVRNVSDDAVPQVRVNESVDENISNVSGFNAVPDLIYRRRWSDVLDSLPNADYLDSLDKIFIYGYANFKLKNFARAESTFAGLFVAQYDLSNWVNYFLAKSAYENGDYNLAHQVASTMEKIPGYGDDIIYIKWRSLWEMGKKQSALVKLDSLWKTGQVKRLEYLYQKAICVLDTGDTNGAINNLRKIIKDAIGKKEYRRYVINSADRLTEISGSKQGDIELIGKAYYYSKKYSDAAHWLGKISNIHKKPRYRYLRDVSLYNIGKYSKALSEFKKMLKQKSYDRNTLWWRIGICQRKLGDVKSASISLDSALYRCESPRIKVNALKQKIFIAQEKSDWGEIAKYSRMLARADAGGNDGSIGLIWCLLSYIIDGKPDSAIYVIRKYRKYYNDKNFQDELSYWESKALLELGDTTASDSILNIIAEEPRYNAFNWLARQQLYNKFPEPDEFVPIKPVDIDSIYISAKNSINEFSEKELISLPENTLFSKAEHLAELGLLDVARTTFAELEKNKYIGDSPAMKLEMWRFYYKHRLYALATRKGMSICSDFKNPGINLLRLKYIMPFPEIVLAEAQNDSINPLFIYGTMIHESNYFNIYAFSYAGARGLMQFIPSTANIVADWFGMKNFKPSMLYDYQLSIKFGAKFLSELINRRNNPIYALAEYNAGNKPVDRWLDFCPNPDDYIMCAELFDYRQTRLYVKKILGNYWTYCWLYQDRIIK